MPRLCAHEDAGILKVEFRSEVGVLEAGVAETPTWGVTGSFPGGF